MVWVVYKYLDSRPQTDKNLNVYMSHFKPNFSRETPKGGEGVLAHGRPSKQDGGGMAQTPDSRVVTESSDMKVTFAT
jgi:hypothetical protein